MLDKEYREDRLDAGLLPQQPIELFAAWYEAARQTEPWGGSAMVLATASESCGLSARVVLMRGLLGGGLCFYTNYESRKGQSLAEQPEAAAVFWWPTQVRQVRFEGTVARMAGDESDAYFGGRPRGSQVGAWASPQSMEIPDLEVLRARYQEREEAFCSLASVPRPAFWGGYRLEPNRVEFWQGGKDRQHDRLLYRKKGGDWEVVRLAP